MPVLKTIGQHRVVLDTHVWIWTMTADPRLDKRFQFQFEKILKTQGVLLSPMSIWELGRLVDKGRIEIDMDVLDWVDQALDTEGLQLHILTPRILIQSTRLPGLLHGDPVDRLLIATAHEEKAVLVTCDKKILEYGKDKFISVYDPSS